VTVTGGAATASLPWVANGSLGRCEGAARGGVLARFFSTISPRRTASRFRRLS
jgi:hypothetical protein